MNRTVKFFVMALLTILLGACDNSNNPKVVADRTDSDGLIRYAMPDGWTNTEMSSGDHYTRVGIDNSPVLAVVARRRSSAPTIAQVQEGTKGKHQMQSHTLVDESTRTQNDFTVWEAVYEANLRGQEVVFHDVYLFSEALQVQVYLNASRLDHDKLASDLQTVVASVQVAAAE